MICADCRRELEIGDQYIEGTPGEIIGQDIDPEISGIIADLLGGHKLDGGSGGKLIYCEDCTVHGGDFLLSTYYGDEDE